MNSAQLGFGARLALALILPWRLLFNGTLAAQLLQTLNGRPALPAPPASPTPTSALQLLAILQREGRLIDFLKEDISAFDDADIGAAARVVHEGCSRGLDEYLTLARVRPEDEGDPVTLSVGFNPAEVRLTGRVIGEAPFSGTLAHHGWRVSKIELPTLAEGYDLSIIAPAEVEL